MQSRGFVNGHRALLGGCHRRQKRGADDGAKLGEKDVDSVLETYKF